MSKPANTARVSSASKRASLTPARRERILNRAANRTRLPISTQQRDAIAEVFRGLRALGGSSCYLPLALVSLLGKEWWGGMPPAIAVALPKIGARAVELKDAESERYRAHDAKRVADELLAQDPVAAEAEREKNKRISRCSKAMVAMVLIQEKSPEEFATLERAIIDAQTRTGVVL